MTIQTQATSVTTTIEVRAPIEHAFRVFTQGIGSWWNPGHHILRAELAEMVFEPRVGGHIIDRGTDGPDRTQVVLTHRHLDRHGDGWQSMRDALGAGWDLTRYADVAAQPAE